MAYNMPDVPAMILVCADHSHSMVPYAPGEPFVRGSEASSIYPAVQNIFLAARALGLGTRLTNPVSRREAQLRALLELPDYIEPVALIPVGYPKGSLGPSARRPAAEVTSYNRFGNRG